jgi:choline dehydrogenase-like flavoprotein
VYAGWDRQERRLSAQLFVLAAGAVENARLLLLSASQDFPNGLANRSGALGKHFMSHPSVDVTGRVKEPVYPFRIGFSTAMTRQFAVERDRARKGAFTLEFLNSAEALPVGMALSSGKWGSALREHVAQEFGHTLGIRIFAEQLPDRQNSVTLNPRVKDYFGNPVPHIAYNVGPYERATLEEATGIAEKILRAAGATETRNMSLRFASHQIGTHRMGRDPRSSVVDGNLRAHDVPNLYLVGSGCFVTGSSSPPTLTIAALAIRTAERIAARLRSG